ncbi:hypothetical protein N7517_003152 [Penicillium concentricum]|uniref:Uncharacterized protein n=1 Tax=Penicillium concentricum TaxID=293559 RepID=A0A9W9VLR8_9EURO|nr:uncharacterized protein N7517_003152 [Penicillium concentricum]KAJ5385241.1 hypothetical protein N7517_003152 [Penicillium concentricum]
MAKGTVTETQASEKQASEKLPTYETTNSSTGKMLNKLKKEIQKAHTPEELLVHLLSTELTFKDKETLPRHAPWSMYVDPDRENVEKVEAQLVNAGHDKIAIVIYWCFFWYGVQPGGREIWIKEPIEIDIERRWISQRKGCIQEKVQVMQNSSELLLSSEDEAKHASQLKIYKDQLTDLNRRHWALCRKQWIKKESMKSWSFKRAYDRQRKDPDWYLSKLLCDDCVGRGGCCGRGCGCCQRPRTVDGSENSINARGRCTTACGCCLEAHRVEDMDVGINEEIPDLKELHFEYKAPAYMTGHDQRLLKGYTFDFCYPKLQTEPSAG